MNATRYENASDFLLATQATLEENEAANGLMLGIVSLLKRFPEKIKAAPFFATVSNVGGLVFAAIMTPPHNIVVYSGRHDCSEAMEIVIRDHLANCWNVPGVLGPSEIAGEFAAIWTRVTGVKHRVGMRQRIYELRQVVHPGSIPGRLRVATEDDLPLVTNWAAAFNREASMGRDPRHAEETAKSAIGQGDLYLWEDGKPVSMAARRRPTTHGVAMSGVYTPPEQRRKGYATACVAGLSQILLDSGYEFCSLFTDLANPTSNSIYQKIGYVPVCDFVEYVFGR